MNFEVQEPKHLLAGNLPKDAWTASVTFVTGVYRETGMLSILRRSSI